MNVLLFILEETNDDYFISHFNHKYPNLQIVQLRHTWCIQQVFCLNSIKYAFQQWRSQRGRRGGGGGGGRSPPNGLHKRTCEKFKSG